MRQSNHTIHSYHTGYEPETKRHNKALEDLAKVKEVWYKNEVAKKDRIQQVTMQLNDADADINQTNHALDELRQIQTIQCKGRQFNCEPQLSDYYKPSKEIKEYQVVVIVLLLSIKLVHILIKASNCTVTNLYKKNIFGCGSSSNFFLF